MSRILVIDDNALIGQMLLDGLTEQGYDVRVALDANQGFTVAREYSPDLIILDVQLPDATGFDLCKVIKGNEELKHVPIIMVTGSARSSEEKVKGFQMGVDDYLTKPFELPELMERVRAILRRTQNSSKPAPKPATPLLPESMPAPVFADRKPDRISILHAIFKTLVSPWILSAKPFVPGISLAFLMISLAFSLGGLALSSGSTSSIVLTAFEAIGIWGITVSALVLSSNIAGIPMKWNEGAGLVSLAASPLLLKFAGAFLVTLWTTLSPFYYTAGLSLLWNGAPVWAARLDVFELWSVILLGSILSRSPGTSKRTAWVVTAVTWVVSAGLAMAIASSGKS